ncbi:serine O-acetyltransferase [Prevotella sp. P2-180]|uniref:serine O-acetyltransferase n=1 Tax=Prevotella sp. P2-180 TaxID=2024224 RepID=UPI000B9721F2|nr:serine acetyltransferase [Prevotella sp. P2-180]MCI7256366.1 serine acetyltransferase [Prevotella sp.]MDD5784850.1 serine acetyltransferase [Prevotella sp.]MDD6864121.1 serine acetyltransferase [Prevotella sp.]MDD7225449.1 serine acetyltransferase [Prevotella sp.]OYP65379.1 serine acetyltransferase [Prevotella sp. P2-180]
MGSSTYTEILTRAVDQLSDPASLKGLFHQHQDGNPLPSGKVLEEIIDLSRAIIFPGYYGKSKINKHTIRYHIGMAVERLSKLLEEQILAGLCFCCPNAGKGENTPCKLKAKEMAMQLIADLPEIRKTLATDVEAAFNGDPAAESFGEIISCYPVIKALTNYRIAHRLHTIGVPLIPRIISEMAHSETGIDIHPAATIGHHFTIDHGTGVVIGATCIIGNYVKLYQGVTLGAKSFPLDDNGNPIKGIARHPILEDNVIVYSNATILGRITIGQGSVVGANIWVTESMEPYSKKYKKE